MDQIIAPIEFNLNRKIFSNDTKFKQACVQPKLTKTSTKLKNIEGNQILGEVYGRVHVRQQDLKSLKLRFSKKIRKANFKPSEKQKIKQARQEEKTKQEEKKNGQSKSAPVPVESK